MSRKGNSSNPAEHKKIVHEDDHREKAIAKEVGTQSSLANSVPVSFEYPLLRDADLTRLGSDMDQYSMQYGASTEQASGLPYVMGNVGEYFTNVINAKIFSVV